MAWKRHLRGGGAFGLVAVAAVVGPGAGVASAGGHSRVVYVYSAPTVPVATTAVPMTMVPVATTGHGFHHRSSFGAVMVAPATVGWTGQAGTAVSQTGFGATPLYGFGTVPMATTAPTSGFGASPTVMYYYPTAAPATSTSSSTGNASGFGAGRTGVAADITSLASNPRYQALAAYMGNDITRVQALRANLLDQFKKLVQQNNGTVPPQGWLESLLLDGAQDFLSFTPYGPIFNQIQPLIQDLIGDVINQGKQTLNQPSTPSTPSAPSTIPTAPTPTTPAAGTTFTFQVTGGTIQGTFTPSGTPAPPTPNTTPTAPSVPSPLQGIPTDPRGPAPATTN